MSEPVPIRTDGTITDLDWSRPMSNGSRIEFYSTGSYADDLTWWSEHRDIVVQTAVLAGIAIGSACVGLVASLWVSLPLIQMTQVPSLVRPVAIVQQPHSDRETFNVPLGLPTPDGCAYYRSLKFPGAGIKRCPWEFAE